MENWKEVFGYPKYECNQQGKVRRKLNQKELKRVKNDRGYNTLTLWLNNEEKKTVKIPKLIWETFNDCKCTQTIDHKDRNKDNDTLQNLRCVSKKENSLNRDNYNQKEPKYSLSIEDKKTIIKALRNKTWTQYRVYKEYGIPTNYISTVLKRGTWDKLLYE